MSLHSTFSTPLASSEKRLSHEELGGCLRLLDNQETLTQPYASHTHPCLAPLSTLLSSCISCFMVFKYVGSPGTSLLCPHHNCMCTEECDWGSPAGGLVPKSCSPPQSCYFLPEALEQPHHSSNFSTCLLSPASWVAPTHLLQLCMNS